MRRMCYLATPIDQAGGRVLEIDTFRMEATRRLSDLGWIVYNPARAFAVGPGGIDRRIEIVNNIALGRSDAVLAYLPQGVASVGVPMEVERALNNSKAVAVVGDSLSWALEHPRIHRVGGWKEAIAWLDAQDYNPAERQALRIRVTGSGFLPTRAYDGDAGFDLYCSEERILMQGEFRDIPCGIKIEMPPGYWALIKPRSSTLRRKGLLVAEGVIDNGYRGEIFVGVQCLGTAAKVEKGERLAQLIPFHLTAAAMEPLWVDELNPSDRGEKGFGSSG